MWESWKLYKKIPDTIIPSLSLKNQLLENYNGFQHWWSLQLKTSVLVYPIATAGGFILGGVLGSGKTVALGTTALGEHKTRQRGMEV